MIGLDRYDIGLAKLISKLDNRRPEYILVLSYESQLQEIKGFLTQFGDTESLRSERARIIYQLNKIAVEITGTSFNALCAQESVSGLTLDAYLEEVVEQYTHELLDEQYKPLGLRADETTDFQSKLGPQLLEIKLTERFVQGSVYRNIGVAGATVTIESVLQAQSRFVLTGDPGAGKTTTLKRLAVYLAQQSLQDEEFGSIPIYVPLILTSVYNLEDLIWHQVKILGLDIPSGEIETLFKNEKIVLLLDGLNEVPFDTYRKCRDAINGLAGYRHCKLIASDRPSYDQSLVGFPVFELEKWNADAIQQYVRQAIDLLGKKRSPGALLDRIDQDPSLYAIVNNPLLLGLLTTVYYEEGQIPLLRAELLSRFVQVLLERDRQKGINEPVSENILKQLLAQLAFAAYQAEKNSLSEQFVCDQLAYQLRNLDDRRFIGNLNAEIVLQRLLRGNWLQKSSEGQYRFNFDILQEWFVAYELAGRWEKQEPFNEWICNPYLEGSIAQISGLLEPTSADAFVNQVLELGGIRLAAQCAISLPPTSLVRQNVIAQLRHQLFSKNEAMRVAASKLFIFLNDISVQEDLIQVIMHDSGAVCWNAALALQRTIDGQIATLPDAHPSDDLFIKILNQSHYNEDVQVTACIALGRSKTKRAISALIQALEKSDRVRRYAAISLGRMNDITAIGLLERAAQEGSIPKVQAGALRALQIARPQRAQSLADQMRYVSNAIVKQEVDVILGIGGDEKTITTYIHQLERGNEVRQKKAIQFLGSVRAVRAVEPLWKLLDQDAFQDSTARALGTIGGSQVIILAAEALRHQDSNKRKAAVKVLGNIRNNEQVLGFLVVALGDQTQSVRDTAKHMLKQLGEPATPLLKHAFEQEEHLQHSDQAITILLCLEEIGTRSAVQTIVQALDCSQPIVVRQAQRSLRRVNREPAILALREKWRKTAPDEQSQLSKLLFELEILQHEELLIDYQLATEQGQQAQYVLERLKQDIQSGVEPTMRSAQAVLNQIDDFSKSCAISQVVALGLDAFKRASQSHDPQRRSWVARELGKQATPGADDLLVLLSHDENRLVCLNAIQSLSYYFTKKSANALKELAINSEKQIKYAAFSVLCGRDDIHASSALVDIFEQEQSERTKIALTLRTHNSIKQNPALFTRMVHFLASKIDLQTAAEHFLNSLREEELPPNYKTELVSALKLNPNRQKIAELFYKFVKRELKSAANPPERTIKEIVRYLTQDTYLDQCIKKILRKVDKSVVQAALIENLTEGHPELILDKLHLLSEICPPTVCQPLEKLLHHAEQKIRYQTVYVLNQIKSDDSTRLLVKALRDINEDVQRLAIQGLCQRPSPITISALVNFARTTQIDALRHEIILRSGTFDSSSVREMLLWAIAHTESRTGELALQTLAQHQSTELNQQLISLINPVGAPVHILNPIIIRALGRLHVQASIALLQNLLQKPQEKKVQQAVALSLLQIGLSDPSVDLRMVEPHLHRLLSNLLSYLSSPDDKLRLEALQQMRGLQADILLPYITKMLDDINVGVRQAAIDTLFAFGTQAAVQQISRATFDQEPKVKEHALHALQELQQQPALADLAAQGISYLVYDNIVALRHSAIKALINNTSQAATKGLVRACYETDEALRRQVIQALATRPVSDVLPRLKLVLADPSFKVRAVAEQVIASIEGNIVRRLIEISQDLQANGCLRVIPTAEAQSLIQLLDAETGTEIILSITKQQNSLKAQFNLTFSEITLLGWLGHPSSYEVLLSLLWSSDKSRRLASIAAVGNARVRVALTDLMMFVRSADIDEKRAAIYALAKIDRSKTIDVLSATSIDKNPLVRLTTIEVLQELVVKERVSLVDELCTDPSPLVRSAAIKAIRAIGNESTVHKLSAQLEKESDTGIRLCILQTIYELNFSPASSTILPLIDDEDNAIAAIAMRLCSKFGFTEAILLLLQKYQLEPRQDLKIAALQAVISMRKSESQAVLRHLLKPKAADTIWKNLSRSIKWINSLQSKSSTADFSSAGLPTLQIRLDILNILTDISFTGSFFTELFQTSLQADQLSLRIAAVKALTSQQSKDMYLLLQHRLVEDESAEVRALIVQALAQIDLLSSRYVLETAFQKETNYAVKRLILQTLELSNLSYSFQVPTDPEEFITYLLLSDSSQRQRLQELTGQNIPLTPQNYLNHPSIFIRREAISQIGQQKLIYAAERLFRYLDQTITPLKIAALDALGKLGVQERAMNKIIQLAESRDSLIQCQAITTLGRWKATPGISSIQRLLYTPQTHYAAAMAFINFGSAESIEITKTLLMQSSPQFVNQLIRAMAQHSSVDWTPVLIAGLDNRHEGAGLSILKNIFYFPRDSILSVLRAALTSTNLMIQYVAIDLVGIYRVGELTEELTALLREENQYSDSYRIAKATRSLGRLSSGQDLALLAKLLQSPVMQIAESAAEAFGQLQAKSGVRVLLSTLELDEHNRVSLASIRALARIGTEEACFGLMNIQPQLVRGVRDEAISALRFFPVRKAVPLLKSFLQDENHYVRQKLVETLSLFSESDVCSELVRVATEDDNVHVRLAALSGLENIPCTPDRSFLISLLNDPNNYIRAKTIQLINQLSPEMYQEELVDLLADENPYIRERAIEALAAIPSDIGYQSIANIARYDIFPRIRQRARAVLARADTPVSMAILQQLNKELDDYQAKLRTKEIRLLKVRIDRYRREGINMDSSPDIIKQVLIDIQAALMQSIPGLRVQAMAAAVRCVSLELLPIFESGLTDDLLQVRNYAVQGLAKLGTLKTLWLIEKHFLRELAASVRLQIIKSLPTSTELPAVIAILRHAVEDPNSKVAKYAVTALRNISHSEVLPLLSGILTKPHPSAFVREAAVNALGAIAGRAAFPVLEKASNDPSWYVRQDAITALATLGDTTTVLKICRKGLEDENLYVKRSAVEALVARKMPQALPIFEQYLKHSSPFIRSKSLEGIQQAYLHHSQPGFEGFNWHQLSTLLANMYNTEDDLGVKLELIQTLATFNLADLNLFFENHLFDANTILRRRILKLGEQIHDQISYITVEKYYLNKVDQLSIVVRRDISYFLTRHAPESCHRLLLYCCWDTDRYVRTNAAYGLKFIADEEAIAQLRRLIRDSDPLVRNVAWQSLEAIMGEKKIVSKTEDLSASQFHDPINDLLNLVRAYSEDIDTRSEEIFQGILQQTKSNNWLDRCYAVLSLKEYPPEKILQILLHLYIDEDDSSVLTEIRKAVHEMPPQIIQNAIKKQVSQGKNYDKLLDLLI